MLTAESAEECGDTGYFFFKWWKLCQIHCGAGCTHLWIYWKPLNYTLLKDELYGMCIRSQKKALLKKKKRLITYIFVLTLKEKIPSGISVLYNCGYRFYRANHFASRSHRQHSVLWYIVKSIYLTGIQKLHFLDTLASWLLADLARGRHC